MSNQWNEEILLKQRTLRAYEEGAGKIGCQTT